MGEEPQLPPIPSISEKYYRKALEIKGSYAPAANNLAYILAERGVKLTEALRFAQLAKAKRPRDPVVLDTLGWVYYQQGRYSTAIDEFKESLSRNPNNALANYHLGWAYYEKRKFNKNVCMKICLNQTEKEWMKMVG